jgi:hypothetical protein
MTPRIQAVPAVFAGVKILLHQTAKLAAANHLRQPNGNEAQCNLRDPSPVPCAED